MYQFSLNLSSLQQKYSLTSNYLGINTVVTVLYSEAIHIIITIHINISRFFLVSVVVQVGNTVLPAKSDSDMFCLQSYQGLRVDRSLVY